MAAAMKIIIGEFLAKSPDIGALALATTAVEDHILKNGCTFEPEAAMRAVERLGIDPAIRAADLPAPPWQALVTAWKAWKPIARISLSKRFALR